MNSPADRRRERVISLPRVTVEAAPDRLLRRAVIVGLTRHRISRTGQGRDCGCGVQAAPTRHPRGNPRNLGATPVG